MLAPLKPTHVAIQSERIFRASAYKRVSTKTAIANVAINQHRRREWLIPKLHFPEKFKRVGRYSARRDLWVAANPGRPLRVAANG
jgi:hypothetical protein